MNKPHSIIAPILQNRTDSLTILTAASFHLGGTYMHLPGWQCPILLATGIPCPGCGLSRAIIMLLKGDLQDSMKLHIFAPIFLTALIALTIILFLPISFRERIIYKIRKIEDSTSLFVVLLVSLFIYWGLRITTNYVEFSSLIHNQF